MSKGREYAVRDERLSEQAPRQKGHDGRYWRIGDKARLKVAGVGDKLQFVPMKPVISVRYHMKHKNENARHREGGIVTPEGFHAFHADNTTRAGRNRQEAELA